MIKRNKTLPAHLVEEFRDTGSQNIVTDVNGSYTGTSADGSPPVQDADDLHRFCD